jgi:uncharacterized membrane protein
MTTEHSMRASDQDREQVVEILRGQYTEGRLTLEEFDERTSAAYAGKTWGDLLNLTRDLPVRLRFGSQPALTGAGAQPPQPPRPPHGAPWPLVRVAPFLLFWLIIASMGGWFWGGPGDGHYHGVFPFFPIIPLVVVFLVIRALAGRRRRHWF